MLKLAKSIQEEFKMSEMFFLFGEGITTKPSNKNFHLHSHAGYEIFLFFDGDAEYIIDDKRYPLAPGDIIIIKKQKMHRIHHLSNKAYNRLVFTIYPDFFIHNQCEELEKIFLSDSLDTGEKISRKTAKASGLYDAIMRFSEYSKTFNNPYTTVTKSVLIEILYLLNNISTFEGTVPINENLTDLIHYLNNNFTDNITLDILCEKFYISKYYLCHIFKEATGLTVQQYVREKRLVKAIELRETGMSLTEAALQVGFDNYSSFFRSFTSRYKTNPTNYKITDKEAKKTIPTE